MDWITAMRWILRSKIHKATVTEADVNYIGSITIDEDLIERVGFWPGEKVLVVSNTSGERLETYVIMHYQGKLRVPATIVPLDAQNCRLFADWDLEIWELLRKLEWYRRPFVQELLHRQRTGLEKTFVILTRLADFSRLLTDCTSQNLSSSSNPLSIQVQAALTVEISDSGPTIIYNIETAPWNKLGPSHRFVSLPAAALFFFAAQHHLANVLAKNKFILSHPTEDGVSFYQKKLQLELLWSRGPDHYAVVDRDSLLQALLLYKHNQDQMRQTLPLYEPA